MRLEDKAQEVDIKELLLLVRVFKKLLTNLLLLKFIEKFIQRLQQRLKFEAILNKA